MIYIAIEEVEGVLKTKVCHSKESLGRFVCELPARAKNMTFYKAERIGVEVFTTFEVKD